MHLARRSVLWIEGGGFRCTVSRGLGSEGAGVGWGMGGRGSGVGEESTVYIELQSSGTT